MSFTPRRALHWLKIVFGNLGRSRTFGIAAEMAFWLFLSLLPLAAVAGLVAAKFAMSNSGAASGLLSSLPPAVRELLTQELTKVSAWNEGAVGPVAALTFIWLASSGIHAVFDGLELETEATARPWWKKRALAMAACVALSIGVAAITMLSVGLGWIRRFAADAVPVINMPSIVSTVLRTGISAAIAVLLIAGLYTIGLPTRARKRMPLWPGAIAAVVLQTTLGVVYGFYVRRAGDGGAYQGALAVIGITLITLYLLCIAVLVGVEVNQILGARRLLEASVHPAMAPPPPVTDEMVCCDDRGKKREDQHLRPSLAGGG
jgi:membrane protein